MNWSQYQKEFECDGGLRDIYVFDANLDDWQKVLDFIRTGQYTYEYKYEDNAAVLPEQAATIFESEGYHGLLSVHVGNLLLNCFFFADDEIDFDLDPKEVKSEKDLTELFGFLRQLCRITNKQAVLTPESGRDLWIFRFNPGVSEPEYYAK